MSHIMKIMNIYWHILTEKRPVFVSKSRKSDIFANSKEIQLINSHSYFGNDYFYLKIYKMLRIIYENFKVISVYHPEFCLIQNILSIIQNTHYFRFRIFRFQ